MSMDEQLPPGVSLPELDEIGAQLHDLANEDVRGAVARRLDARLTADRSATPLGERRRAKRRSGGPLLGLGLGVSAAVAAALIFSLANPFDSKSPAVSDLTKASDTAAAGSPRLAKPSARESQATLKSAQCLPPCKTKLCRTKRQKARKAHRLKKRVCRADQGAPAPGG